MPLEAAQRRVKRTIRERSESCHAHVDADRAAVGDGDLALGLIGGVARLNYTLGLSNREWAHDIGGAFEPL
jgi:hypothetical protein